MSKLVKENAEYLAQETTDKLNTLYTVRTCLNIIYQLFGDTDIVISVLNTWYKNDIMIFQLGKEGK